MTVRTRHTIVRAASRLTKEITLDEDGRRLVKRAAVSPARGVFIDVACAGDGPLDILTALATDLGRLRSNEALLLSTLPSALTADGDLWGLCTKNTEGIPGTLARTKANFGPVDGTAIGFLDFDLPEAVRASIPGACALLENVLIPAWPGFADVAMLIRPSVSSGARKAGQNTPPPIGGYHCFFIIDDGLLIGAIADQLFDRLASMGHAVVLPSRRGSRLRRALVDAGASRPERLIFEADPVLGDGVEAMPREPFLHGNRLLAAADILRDLEAANHRDAAQRAAYWKAAEEQSAAACAAAKALWLKDRVKVLVEVHKMPPKAAREAAKREQRAYDGGTLWDDDRIALDDGSEPSVFEILSDPRRYAWAKGPSIDEDTARPGVTFVCPYERPADASIGRPAGPYLHSYEHGGRYWRLRSARIAPRAAMAELFAEVLRGLIANEIGRLEAARR